MNYPHTKSTESQAKWLEEMAEKDQSCPCRDAMQLDPECPLHGKPESRQSPIWEICKDTYNAVLLSGGFQNEAWEIAALVATRIFLERNKLSGYEISQIEDEWTDRWEPVTHESGSNFVASHVHAKLVSKLYPKDK